MPRYEVAVPPQESQHEPAAVWTRTVLGATEQIARDRVLLMFEQAFGYAANPSTVSSKRSLRPAVD